MHNEFTAIVEKDDNWFVAYSPEVPGANGQGKTKAESLRNLADAIALILEDRRDDGLRGAPETAEHDIVTIAPIRARSSSAPNNSGEKQD